MRLVVIGATSAIALACCAQWCQNHSMDVHLIGRDEDNLSRASKDLSIRYPQSRFQFIPMDLEDYENLDKIAKALISKGNIDILLIAHGYLPDQKKCEIDINENLHALSINAISPIMCLEIFSRYMASQKQGIIGIIGSVAGDRGRKSNYIYGASKGFIERYVEGLQHRMAKSQLRVSLIKPGPTATPMTSHLQANGKKMADVNQVARTIVNGLERGKLIIYAPALWKWIMLIIKNIPTKIFHKLDL